MSSTMFSMQAFLSQQEQVANSLTAIAPQDFLEIANADSLNDKTRRRQCWHGTCLLQVSAKKIYRPVKVSPSVAANIKTEV